MPVPPAVGGALYRVVVIDHDAEAGGLRIWT
jgi:hypothetical protein